LIFKHFSFIIFLYSHFTATKNQGLTAKKFTVSAQMEGATRMGFIVDKEELKPGLIVFRRADVKHKNWYCRIGVPDSDQYKTISLKTPDLNEARIKAFDHDADVRFRIKHNVPIFEKSFAEVAEEYAKLKKSQAEAGQITMRRWQSVDGHIRLHLIPYIGNVQITHVGHEKWDEYPLWRKKNGGGLDGTARDGSIRQEMITYRGVMRFAADRSHIPERNVPKGKMPQDHGRREAFSPTEYKQLHTFARKWVKEGTDDYSVRCRTMAYNFMLVMTNTGMRPSEARNLKWRDVSTRKDQQGRSFLALNVRGKGKFRELVAAISTATYFERIKAISKATQPDDFVFTNPKGQESQSLYQHLIENLLTDSGLLMGSAGTRRSTYCFRHTYATFRLMQGTDVIFLAKQMGTSVKMIENHYGHITPVKNAERILQGVPGWEPQAEDSGAE
jgi:integrase